MDYWRYAWVVLRCSRRGHVGDHTDLPFVAGTLNSGALDRTHFDSLIGTHLRDGFNGAHPTKTDHGSDSRISESSGVT